MPAVPATARIRAAVRRIRSRIHCGAQPDRWATYLAEVEPALAALPRVHRFARPPVTGEMGPTPAPLAVWIEGDAHAGARTRQSLESGTNGPAAVLRGSLNDALTETRCERVALVRAGDVLGSIALERLGQGASLAPDAVVITCDDDVLDAAGRRGEPRFRPGPSPDRWLACDDSGPLLVIARERAAALLPELSGATAWRHELAIALAGDAGQHHAHVPVLLCHRGPDVPDAPDLPARDLASIVARWRPGARVETAGPIRRVRSSPQHEPSVEVIVCLRDRHELLARCVSSLLTVTGYDRLTVTLVDNASSEPETIAQLQRLRRHARVRVVRDERPFNFAALNNAAARASSADVLVFLNNDTEIVDPEWIATLLEEAMRPQVGAVAPLLLYPDGTVQHAGAALGLHGFAGHPFAGLEPTRQTPFGRADGGTRNWLAVTAACMMVERAKFTTVGGFDESFIVAGNDVDLCLRLTAAGYRSLCVPHAVVVHDESLSRGSHIDPSDYIRSSISYGQFRTVGDPFYNPNLTLQRTDCAVRVPGEGPG